jgi:hypothetical protein
VGLNLVNLGAGGVDEFVVGAAVRTSWATSSGWDTIATWLTANSTVAAPIRPANSRSASGGIAWSWVATRYQVGAIPTHDRLSRPGHP